MKKSTKTAPQAQTVQKLIAELLSLDRRLYHNTPQKPWETSTEYRKRIAGKNTLIKSAMGKIENDIFRSITRLEKRAQTAEKANKEKSAIILQMGAKLSKETMFE